MIFSVKNYDPLPTRTLPHAHTHAHTHTHTHTHTRARARARARAHIQSGYSIELKKTTHKTMITASNCKLYVKFSLKSAVTPRERTPCSNRPAVLCEL